jgi:hypothetical protein
MYIYVYVSYVLVNSIEPLVRPREQSFEISSKLALSAI